MKFGYADGKKNQIQERSAKVKMCVKKTTKEKLQRE